jgi:hypothetical protein
MSYKFSKTYTLYKIVDTLQPDSIPPKAFSLIHNMIGYDHYNQSWKDYREYMASLTQDRESLHKEKLV